MSTIHSDEVVFGLIDEVGHLSGRGEVQTFLSRIVRVYDLQNIAYFGTNIPGSDGSDPYPL